jgi:hypothetical protein
MQTFLRLVLATGFAIALNPEAATASTYKSYHCHCVPTEASFCTCEAQSYTLCAFCAREFRGYCDEIPYGTGRKDITVSGRNKNTTCTVAANLIADYVTKSCTNWSVTTKDTVSVQVLCRDQ